MKSFSNAICKHFQKSSKFFPRSVRSCFMWNFHRHNVFLLYCIFCLHYTKPTPKHTHHRKLFHFYILCMTLVWFISCYFQGDQKCPHKDKNFRYWHRYGDIVPIMLGLAGHTLSHIDTHTHTHTYLSIYIYIPKKDIPSLRPWFISATVSASGSHSCSSVYATELGISQCFSWSTQSYSWSTTPRFY